MKKYLIISTLCIVSSLQSAEQKPVTERKPVEWNAQEYDNGNKVQLTCFCHFLEENRIAIENKRILSIGCGVGNLEKILSAKAKHIDGFDPSHNMINFATNKHRGTRNLRFYKGFAEEFIAEKPYDFAFASFSFHWFEDKPLALKTISTNLAPHAEFFFTAHSSEDPKPVNLVVAEEIMASPMGMMLDSAINLFSTNQSKATGASYPTREELRKMVLDAGFEIITCEQQSCSVILKDRAEVEAMQRPIMMSRPVVQLIPEILREYLFSNFIDRVLTKFKQNELQEYIDEVTTTIVHVRKK